MSTSSLLKKNEKNEIIALDSQRKDEEGFLPSTSFIMAIYGARGVGKSNMMLNMLINPNLLKGRFQEIYLISPTAQLDDKFRVLRTTNVMARSKIVIKKEKKLSMFQRPAGYYSTEEKHSNTKMRDENFITSPTVEFLQNMIENQKLDIAKYGKEKTNEILLVFDDCICNKIFKNAVFTGMIFNSRHFKISCIITSQTYHAVPKSIRLNCSICILFFTSNTNEIKSIYAENGSSYKPKEFVEIFNDVTGQEFKFLMINYHNKKNKRIADCFTSWIN